MASAQPRILITACSGQVGGKLAALAPAGYELILTSRTDQVSVPRSDAQLVLLDLSKLADLRQLVREHRPQLIINAAAYTAVDKAESDAEAAHCLNAQAPAVLAEEARLLDIPFIHYSTDYVFDGSGSQPRDETAATAPLSVYGQSKLAGERAIAATGCDAVVLRTSWVFSDLGQNFVKTMLRLGAEREQLRIVADQVGAPTSAAFLARMSWRIAEDLLGEKARRQEALGLYHLACAGETNWHAFALEIFAQARALGQVLKVQKVEAILSQDYPTPAKRPQNSRLDCRKFEQRFACTRQTWRDALSETLEAMLR